MMRLLSIATLGLLLSVSALLPGGAGNQNGAFPSDRPSSNVTTGSMHAVVHRAPAYALASAVPTFQWDTADIYYGQGDPVGLLFGEGSVLASDNHLHTLVTFGGLGPAGLSNITLLYTDPTTGAWAYTSSTVSPSARANSSFATDAGHDVAVLFGGLGNVSSHRTLNDTWLYRFTNDTWVNVSSSVAPPARENAALAVDARDGIAVLEGGLDPAFRSGSGSGAVLWNDTWQFNLSTQLWSRLAVSASPPPLYGSQMIWDPVLQAFLLFGGCDQSGCANSVWSLPVGGSHWSRLGPGGSAPSARASAAFSWDPYYNDSVLYGGFEAGPTGPVPLGGTYELDARATTWNSLSLGSPPPPEFGSAAAFADYPGCIGMWVQGGSPALQGTIYNVSILAPVPLPSGNCFPSIGGGTGGGPPAKCSNTSAHLTVQLRDASSSLGIVGGHVEIAGSCGSASGVTGAAGFLNITEAAPDVLTITASAFGYHGATVGDTYTGRPGSVVVIPLARLPDLHARVFGRTATGTAPLAGATVTVDSAIVVGQTSVSGWINSTTLQTPGTAIVVTASAPEFSSLNATVALPTTGSAFVNLTVLAFGSIDVLVRDARSGGVVPLAMGNLSYIDPVGPRTRTFATDAEGWYNVSARAGNYSVSASARGYYSNTSTATIVHDWIDRTVVWLNLTPIYGADVDVLVLNSVRGTPIENASVDFGGLTRTLTDALGWGNATDLRSTGLLRVDVSAAGYYPASATVLIGPYVVFPRLVIHLMPAPPCSPFAPCPAGNGSSTGPGGFSLLPPGGAARSVVLGVPALLAIAGVVVALTSRSRALALGRARPAAAPARPDEV